MLYKHVSNIQGVTLRFWSAMRSLGERGQCPVRHSESGPVIKTLLCTPVCWSPSATASFAGYRGLPVKTGEKSAVHTYSGLMWRSRVDHWAIFAFFVALSLSKWFGGKSSGSKFLHPLAPKLEFLILRFAFLLQKKKKASTCSWVGVRVCVGASWKVQETPEAHVRSAR